MADFQIPDKTLETSIDRATDSFLVYDSSASALRRTVVNNMLNITGAPVGSTDIQTLTNKTLTAPTISSPVLSGTVTGTYTIGGTPTFPSSVVTLTGSQTLTNKVLTSPTINTATISNPTLTTDTVSEFTSAAGVTIDGVLLKDSKMNGSYITDATVNTAQLVDSSVTNTKVAVGAVIQVASTLSSAYSSGSTTIPFDDTIPQITEGDEYMTVSITPKSATNILRVKVKVSCSPSALANIVGALFRDSTANAFAVAPEYNATANGMCELNLEHDFTAGSTSSTTFRLRAAAVGSTLYFNGDSSGRKFGTTTKSSITVMEIKA